MTGKTKQIATTSLLVMAVGFITTLVISRVAWRDNSWILVLLSGFEAGLVGGIADWFAVTALFRHPFGLPIPHTAILPGNRNRITQALVSMVENDLLNKKSILKKVQDLDVARRILETAEKNLHTEAVKSILTQVLRSMTAALPEEEILATSSKLIHRYLERADIGVLVKVLADEGLSRHYDEAAFNLLLEKAEDSLSTEKVRQDIGVMAADAIRTMPMTGLMKLSVPAIAGIMGEQKIGKLMQDFLLSLVKDMRNPENQNRAAIMSSLHEVVAKLHQNKDVLDKLDAYRQDFLAGHDLDDYIRHGLVQAREGLLRLIDDAGTMEGRIVPFLESILSRASQDEDMIMKLETFIDAQLSNFIDSHHESIGRLVRENIDRFDTVTLIRMIEEKVGNDLQWIRVNGAICGFAVGIVLHGIKALGSIVM
jgi:uncharacterized membrane-anchored protein YjiN (DUF445 family)